MTTFSNFSFHSGIVLRNSGTQWASNAYDATRGCVSTASRIQGNCMPFIRSSRILTAGSKGCIEKITRTCPSEPVCGNHERRDA